MYIKVTNNVIEKYPYTIGQLIIDNPFVSFPAEISEQTLEDYGVFPVNLTIPTQSPDVRKEVVEDTPARIDGKWFQTWKLVDIDEKEFERKTAIKRGEVRRIRDSLLSQSDWSQMTDTPITDDQRRLWITYRQALRDVPQQEGFPWHIVWPTLPS